jgi:hypothetical protein
MSSELQTELARLATTVDYTVEKADDGSWRIVGNEAALLCGAVGDATRRYTNQVNASLTGAYIVELFRDEPWLESFTLELYAESEHDDQGGSYRTVGLRAPNAQARGGAELPDEVMEEGEFSEDLAESLIEERFEDSRGDMYAAFVDDHGCEDLEFSVQRNTIAHLVHSSQSVSGKLAFELLFPEYVWRVKTSQGSDVKEVETDAPHQPMAGTEYLFDAKLLAAIHVRAASVEEARRLLGTLLDCASCSLKLDATGQTMAFEASIDGQPDLIEVDGKHV